MGMLEKIGLAIMLFAIFSAERSFFDRVAIVVGLFIFLNSETIYKVAEYLAYKLIQKENKK